MPLHIIKEDITKIKCDAIVNAANNTLLGGGGVDGAIHKAAGAELLEECKMLGGCKTGEAKITRGYNLPCKYIIHTVGPVFSGGKNKEKELLESCYKNALELAKENNCEIVAFPLISSGAYGYPKDKALEIAVKSISEFLLYNEMTVYITVFDKKSYQISEPLYQKVAEYINYNLQADREACIAHRFGRVVNTREFPICGSMAKAIKAKEERDLSLLDMLNNMDDNFVVTLLKLIDLKGITDVECYKKANVSKQTWYKIMNEKGYKPSKNTVICFAIALELSLDETKHLLSTVGFTLSKSSKFDIIIEYFLINKEYDIFVINETLFKFDQVCLGV